MTDPVTATPSLQRRVIVLVVALLAVLLGVLGGTVDFMLRTQAERNLHDRLLAATSRADALVAAGTPPDLLAAQLNGGSVRALVVMADGVTYGDPGISPDTKAGSTVPPPFPPPPPGHPHGPLPSNLPPLPSNLPPPPSGLPPPPPTPRDATATVVVHPLPDGARLILVADTTQTTQVTRQLRQIMFGAGLATLLLAAVLLVAISRAALRPLERLTALARDISTGDRGRRLRPSRANTELGRAATAFDGMLDALEDSELRARQAADTAQRAEAATRQFLADAAHELRTPIAGIQAAAEQLAAHQSDVEDAQRRRASLLQSDARRAGRLVADMLDLSRIDAGLVLDRQDTDLGAIVDAEVQRATMLAPQLSIVRTGLATLDVEADPTRIAQILSNLLDNARRHTPPGGSITVDLSADSAAVVTVTDTGPGVPDDERRRIFERLVRLDADRARDHGGAGLGLSIARALARAHGGDLVCVPHDGGARFRLSLELPPRR
ncbi:two-component sensor histidine kinase [Mycobacterium kiyosense]|uniref:histidine kinase n=2 Tax=Mycobacterium kiyosense TaxID=2871094 RepID=A0A9P3Q4G4_9MYCO|nr:HAMP domain-containing sensor histidine kinase [Mycobacterium kiyosense]GLB83008.1 two-component sensor histidine kinase [Mycobacterium kiyosense]GLB94398.1 two-component sensor histidine kinase [Mycobacterium kiyosense]GLD30816.1 two-component sensor histidine kinase [Mycobacterium kiyosense]GLD34267.1 two-component sensor histidine kinase [Mycobacterium kiyosense]GLD41014.1 two-component sensor histidine kinase [Mycobacterium kiyosense]